MVKERFLVSLQHIEAFGFFRRLEARVSNLGDFLFLSCVTTGSGFDLFPFLYTQGFRCEPLSLSTNHYFLARVSYSIWLLDKSLLPLEHRASTQLSRLSRRHAKKRGLTLPYSVSWRTTSDTNNTLLKDK